MSNNYLEWIQEWIAENCDGDWEHAQNFTITTIDNPGWGVTVNLVGTILEGEQFATINEEKSDKDWFCCRVVNNQFLGDGGLRNLTNMLEIFINWAKSCKNKEDCGQA